jgi:hypothetical protein
MIRFERTSRGRYAAVADNRTYAYVEKFQGGSRQFWIAWDAKTQHAIQGPFGLGGSPFRTLAAAKTMIREQYEGQS